MSPVAKFLVLTGAMTGEPTHAAGPIGGAAPRATLFDGEQRLLGEVIEDDGFIVDSLMQTATACPVPRPEMLQAMVPPPSPNFPVRCFALAGD